MKKRFLSIMAICLVVSLFSGTLCVSATEDIGITIDGQEMTFDQMPVNIDGRVLVPLRGIFEALGAEIFWNDATKTVKANDNINKVRLTIDNNIAQINGKEIKLDVAPTIINSRTMVPVRFVAEALGKKVDWVDSTKTVIIEGEKKNMAELKSTFHRNVPTEFQWSEDMYDLPFYSEKSETLTDFIDRQTTGTKIMGEEALIGANLDCPDEYGTMEVVDAVGGIGFTKAVRCDITTVPSASSMVVARFLQSIEGASAGDVCVLQFYARCVSGGQDSQGEVQAQVQDPITHAKALFQKGIAGSSWTRICMPFIMQEDSTNVGIRFGFGPQCVEAGGFEIINFKDTVAFDALPSDNSVVSDEFKSGAAWRSDAIENIKKIRKGDFSVVVKDKEGNVIPNANVTFNMFEHEFQFGTCITGRIKSDEKYNEFLASNFNTTVIEHFQKWGVYAQDNGAESDKQVEAAKNLGIKYQRGHSLVWEKEKSLKGTSLMPDEVFEKMNDKAALLDVISTHLNEIMPKYKDEIHEWDVENEMVSNTILRNIHGNEILVDIYDIARKAYPEATLYYNETIYNEKMWDLIDFMYKNNVDCDGIGIQSHYDAYAPTPTSLKEMYDKIGSMGYRTKVTEFSAKQHTEDLKADLLRDTMIVTFANEYADGFLMWGFWDGTLTNERSIMYDKDWNIREAGKVYQDLVYNKWWTKNAKASTDAKGKATINGFYGDYDVTVEANGTTKTVSCAYHKGYENVLEITVE
ncbi:MAG: hypothetical protein E7396_02535 [Ruminococcaceae bacterium]|nr:hypothetical protein [Oscillospiraceae bacterium]